MTTTDKTHFNRSILCVDDEEDVLQSYRDVLIFDPQQDIFADILGGEGDKPTGGSFFREKRSNYNLFLARSGEEAVRIVEQEKARGGRIAAGFFDMRMPGGIDGYETIKRIRAIDPQVLCAIVTAFYDRNLEQIRRLFVEDQQDELLYFKKPFSTIELRQTAFNMVSAWNRKRLEEKQISELTKAYKQLKSEIEERERIQANLQQTQTLLVKAKDEWEEAFNTINDVITLHDLDFNIVRANKAAENLFNLPMEQLLRQKCYQTYHGTTQPPEWCLGQKLFSSRQPSVTEFYEPHLAKHIEVKVLPRLDKNNKLTGFIHVVRDIDDRKRAEQEQQKLQAELLHAQKMEIVGRLAGGVAHDFNNMLSAIIGYAELSLYMLPDEHPVKEYVANVREAGVKAERVVKQLLAFSRKQVLEMKVVHLNTLVENMTNMLRRLIGEDIAVELETRVLTRAVMVDPVQIEQILMNLAVNSRDAMPTGGRFIIAVSDVEIIDPGKDRLPGIKPGSYVLLRVTDTGEGMEPEVLEKIFDPFFTTKKVGKGTGLGLATVYGIVKQHKGYIYVESKVGHGTAFEVYLPVTQQNMEKIGDKEPASMPGGIETVLVAEDDQVTRKLVCNTLKPLGYKLLEASNGTEALEVSASYTGEIDVLLTDVIMPGLNGRELAEKLHAVRPVTKIIFMSGYTDDIIGRHGVLTPGMIFLQKPLSPSVLANKIRAVLDEK